MEEMARCGKEENVCSDSRIHQVRTNACEIKALSNRLNDEICKKMEFLFGPVPCGLEGARDNPQPNGWADSVLDYQSATERSLRDALDRLSNL